MEQKRIEEITKYAEDGRSYGLTFKAEQILKECLAEMDRLQKERDAAVADIGRGVSCETCAHWSAGLPPRTCAVGGCESMHRFENWQWRGLEN